MTEQIKKTLTIALWWACVILAIAGTAVVLLADERGSRDTELCRAIEWVESRGDRLAYNNDTDAAGCMQIRPIMVKDVNRILRHRGRIKRYSLEDRFDCKKSHEMFWIYTEHYSENASREVIARRWYGGPDGDKESNTYEYWTLVKTRLLEQRLDRHP